MIKTKQKLCRRIPVFCVDEINIIDVAVPCWITGFDVFEIGKMTLKSIALVVFTYDERNNIRQSRAYKRL